MFNLKKTYSDSELAKQCKQGKSSAQHELYKRYSEKMLALCLRYADSPADAEDVMVNAFVKVFEKINQFSGEGSLEGWLRRIMVNESLMYLRKHKHLRFAEGLETAEQEMATFTSSSELEAQELLELVQSLPAGYRSVFNLYAIEGYSHKEIAAQLGISVGTSKSQLSKARKMLQEKLEGHDRQADNYQLMASMVSMLLLLSI